MWNEIKVFSKSLFCSLEWNNSVFVVISYIFSNNKSSILRTLLHVPFFSSSLVLLSPNIVKNINLALESGGSLVASEGIGNVGKDDLDPIWVGLGDLSLYLILRFSNLAISTSENEKRTLSWKTEIVSSTICIRCKTGHACPRFLGQKFWLLQWEKCYFSMQAGNYYYFKPFLTPFLLPFSVLQKLIHFS